MDSNGITYRIEKSRGGADTLIVTAGGRDVPLHSRVDPERESGAFRDRLDPGRYDLVIALGVGLGYHLLPARERLDEYYHLVLVDALPGLEGPLRQNPLTSFLLGSPRVTLLSGRPAGDVAAFLSGIIDLDLVRGISVIEHPASLRLFGDYYAGIKKSIDDMVTVRAGNRATRQAFGPLFMRNILKNFERLGEALPVRDLFGAFAGFPAVIAGSGPSLGGDIGALARHQDRMFIVAADSALPVLRGSGIAPDIVVTIDPQPYVREHFMAADAGDAIRVFSITSHPSVMAPGAGYLSLNSHPFAQLADEAYGGSIGSIDSATGNVAGDALDLCLKCGFSAVGITGFDFSFPDFEIYARGTAYQRRYGTYFQDRLDTVEGWNARYIRKNSGGLRQAGRFTRRSFLHYRQALEDYVRKSGVQNLHSLNDRGLPVPGVRVTGVDKFMDAFCADAIEKKGMMGPVRSRGRKIGSGPIREALRMAAGGPLMDELLAASLGGAGARQMKRYREMAGVLALTAGGK